MMCEEDILRCEEAKHCDSCPGWLHHCKTECCKVVFLYVNHLELKKGGRFLSIRKPNMTLGEIWYYRLRGVDYTRGLLRFPKHRIVSLGRKLAYVHPCELLTEDGLCSGHPDKKPELCRALTLDTARTGAGGRLEVTDNCLFKYKLMGEDKLG